MKKKTEPRKTWNCNNSKCNISTYPWFASIHSVLWVMRDTQSHLKSGGCQHQKHQSYFCSLPPMLNTTITEGYFEITGINESFLSKRLITSQTDTAKGIVPLQMNNSHFIAPFISLMQLASHSLPLLFQYFTVYLFIFLLRPHASPLSVTLFVSEFKFISHIGKVDWIL